MKLYLDWVNVLIVSLQVRSCDGMRWIQCILLTVSVYFCMIDIDNKFHNMLILVFGGVIIFSTYVEKGGAYMGRPCRLRRICNEPAYDRFDPAGYPGGEKVTLTLDEYETIRVIDLEKLTHEQCARQMDISRTTVTEIYESAREKIADSLVNGKTLVIAGGRYRICDGSAAPCCREHCRRVRKDNTAAAVNGVAGELPAKGEHIMRIAVTYENGDIFQHFGHTEQFKIYDAEDGKIVNDKVIGTDGNGHGALAGFLASQNVDVLICGGIGGGAKSALAEAGIKLYGGATGSADAAAAALAAGKLSYDPEAQCHDHDHAHGEGHACGHGGHSCH